MNVDQLELYIGDDEKVTVNKDMLTDFVTNEWDFSSLQDFMDNYIQEDAWQIVSNLPDMVIERGETTC